MKALQALLLVAVVFALPAGGATARPDVLPVAVRVVLPDSTLRPAGPTEPAEPDSLAQLLLEPLGGRRRDPIAEPEVAREEFLVSLQVPGSVELSLPRGSVWRVTLRKEGLWSDPEMVRVDEGLAETVLRAQPAGRVTGQLAVGEDDPLPATIELRFAVAGEGPEQVMTRRATGCPVAPAGRFSCQLPAGRFDVRLRAEGFISHYLWNVTVPAGGDVSLGRRGLKRGASLVAWVQVDEMGRDFSFSEVTVELSPQVAAVGHQLGDEEKRRFLVRQEQPDERGFVELEGVAPGAYRLAVGHPGYSTFSVAPVEVFAGSETEVREVRLSRPFVLRLELDPATDPWGKPWRVDLDHPGEVPGFWQSVVGDRPANGGRLAIPGMAAGLYRVRIRDRGGSRWLSREVDVTPASPVLSLALPSERIEARVSLRGEPLAQAMVWFGGRQHAISIGRPTDEEGAAFAFVPQRESWSIEVRGEDPPVRAVFKDVHPRPHPTKPWSLVELEVPPGEIVGKVVREDGGPTRDARVHATSGGDTPRFFIEEVDEETGEFALAGLDTGTWTLEALLTDEAGARWSSASRPLLVGAAPRDGEGPGDRVELVLRHSWQLSGQVFGPSGEGVPGARIVALTVGLTAGLAGGGASSVPTSVVGAVTGPSGEFDLEVPWTAAAVDLTVWPPGFASAQLGPIARDSGPLLIPVDRVAGTLVLEGLTGLEDWSRPPKVFQRHLIGLPNLFIWAQVGGGSVDLEHGRVVIPHLAPGLYTVCSPAVNDFEPARAPEDSRCEVAEVSPFALATIRLPPADEEAADQKR